MASKLQNSFSLSAIGDYIQSPEVLPPLDQVITDRPFARNTYFLGLLMRKILPVSERNKNKFVLCSAEIYSGDRDRTQNSIDMIRRFFFDPDYNNKYKRILLYLAIDSPTYGPDHHTKHAVACLFDKEKNVLTYQDSHGIGPSDFVLSVLRKGFPDTHIQVLGLRQQKDLITGEKELFSCAYLAIYNLFCFAHDIEPDEDVNIRDLRWHIHALLDEAIREHDIPKVPEDEREIALSLMRHQLWLDSRPEV